MELYQGFDTFSGKTKSTAVKALAEPPTTESEANITINVATSMEELQSALDIEGSMKVSYAAFSAEAKSKYVHELNLTSNSVVVVIYANKLYATDRLDVEIPAEILATMKTEDGVDDFVKKYGDSWVSRIVKGGEFYVTFTFYAETKKEKELVENSLSANGVIAGVSVNASLAVKISNMLNTSKVRYNINKKLVGYSNLTPPSKITPDKYVADLIDFADSLMGLQPDKPAMISYETTPYDELLPAWVNFERVTANRSSFMGNPAAQGWGEMVAQLNLAMTTCDAIKGRYRFYNNYKDSELETRLTQIKKDLDYLYKFIAAVDAKPNREHPFEIPPSLLYGIPALQLSVVIPVSQDFLNGGGGGPYQDVKPANIPQHFHLNRIRISNGTVVDMIQLNYTTEFPAGEMVTEHGTPGGKQHPDFFLGSGEYVVAMGGKMTNYWGHSTVSVLYFKTNRGNVYATSDDAKEKSDKHWEAAAGDLLLGFSGSSGNNLDCIQPVVLRFSAASWEQLSFRLVGKAIEQPGTQPGVVTEERLAPETVLADPRPLQVANIPPDRTRVSLGRIRKAVHIYNTGRPGQGKTKYWISIKPRVWIVAEIDPGDTQTFSPDGNEVIVENFGPSMLQALWTE